MKDEIRVGDRVRVSISSKEYVGMVICIKPKGLYDLDLGDDLVAYNVPIELIGTYDLFGQEFTGSGKTNCFRTDNSGAESRTTLVEKDPYWEVYRAELAAKIAVAYAEKGRYEPREIGKIAADVANDVVWNLTKRSE